MDAVENLSANLFRPTKKRKFVRQVREDDDSHTPPIDQPNGDADPTAERALMSTEPTVAEIIRLRRASRALKHGVGFSNAKQVIDGQAESNALVTVDSGAERPTGISDRFIGHTGQVVDVDKHMFVSARTLFL